MLGLTVKTKEAKFEVSDKMLAFAEAIKKTSFYKEFITALFVVKEEPDTLFYTAKEDVTNTARRVAGELFEFEEFAFVDLHYLNAPDASDPDVYTVMEV